MRCGKCIRRMNGVMGMRGKLYYEYDWIDEPMTYSLTMEFIITLTSDVFKVEYIIANLKTVFYTESKNHYHFSNQSKYLRYKLLVFANSPGDRDSIPDQVIPKTKKWYLMSPCLTLSIIRLGSRVKWSNPGKGVAPSPIPWCCSYWKGSL